MQKVGLPVVKGGTNNRKLLDLTVAKDGTNRGLEQGRHKILTAIAPKCFIVHLNIYYYFTCALKRTDEELPMLSQSQGRVLST